MKIENKLISDIMDSNPLVLQPHCSIGEALQRLHECKVDSAPVVDQQLKIVGFFSSHDLLVHLWSNNYNRPSANLSIEELMQVTVETANASDSVLQLAERMSIDHDQLYPVNSSGMLTSMRAGTLEQRARAMKVAKPKQYPVVKDDKIIGMVSRAMVVNALHEHCYQTKGVSKAKVA